VSGAYSGLGAIDRATARRLLLKGVGVLMDNPPAVHYTQNMVDRWEGINDEIIPWTSSGRLNGRCIRHGDCSSTVTWLLWLALKHHFHMADHVNGQNWKAGYTGTLYDHGKHVVFAKNMKVGDLIIYGSSPSRTEHVTMSIGGSRVFSHGSEAGPFILPYNYRGDILGIRRYI
jgi:hypothetical protein